MADPIDALDVPDPIREVLRGIRREVEAAYRDGITELEAKVARYETAIRKHRDQRGDDRCYLDDDELYAELPEGKAGADTRLCEPEVMLENCRRYIAHRHNPALPYISPERELEALRAELEKERLRRQSAEVHVAVLTRKP